MGGGRGGHDDMRNGCLQLLLLHVLCFLDISIFKIPTLLFEIYQTHIQLIYQYYFPLFAMNFNRGHGYGLLL